MGVFVKFLLHLDSFVDDSCVTQILVMTYMFQAEKSIEFSFTFVCFGCYFNTNLSQTSPRFVTIHTRCFHGVFLQFRAVQLGGNLEDHPS